MQSVKQLSRNTTGALQLLQRSSKSLNLLASNGFRAFCQAPGERLLEKEQKGLDLLQAVKGRARIRWTPPTGLTFPVELASTAEGRPINTGASLGRPSKLPFIVYRTEKGNNIPVYRDFRGHNKVYTVLKRVRGRVDLLAVDMERVCGGRKVTVRPGPRLVVEGDFLFPVREWVRALGF